MDSTRYNFGAFELDAAAFELRHNGAHVHLERIPMELLFLLVSRRGELLSREEIVEKLWGNAVFIDTNTAINVAIRKVRQALDDNPEGPAYILTVPAKGYRFIGFATAEAGKPPNGDAARPSECAGNAGDKVVDVPEHDILPNHRRSEQHAGPGWVHLAKGHWSIWIAVAVLTGLVIAAVVRSRHPTAASKLMFVVLPFENLTGDPAQEYIADGMTEQMITQMGGLDPERIGVIARTSAMHFKGTQEGIAEIARQLGVGYLLEGSVRRVGNHVRVTAQLIQASDQTHLWAADYDRNFGDMLRLESDIAGAIAGQVQVRLGGHVRPRSIHAVSPEAQAAYLRGLEEWNLRTSDSIENAIAEFQRAIAADPNYALPYAALARCYAIGPVLGAGDPLETMPRARELATHALKLDPHLAEAHSLLAMVAAHYDYDWPAAEREFQTALRLNPSDPYAHFFYSNSYLSPNGRHKEAIEEMQKAIALDPLSPPLQAFLVRTYIWARQYDDARSQLEKTNEIAPNLALLHERAAHLFATTGALHEAIDEDARARLLSGEPAERVIGEKDLQWKAFQQRGAKGYWQAQLDLSRSRLQPPEAYATPFGEAVIYARLQERDAALNALEQAYARRDVQLTEASVEPAFDGLRSNPRFRALLNQIHLTVGRR